jgi:hypothetical protein
VYLGSIPSHIPVTVGQGVESPLHGAKVAVGGTWTKLRPIPVNKTGVSPERVSLELSSAQLRRKAKAFDAYGLTGLAAAGPTATPCRESGNTSAISVRASRGQRPP